MTKHWISFLLIVSMALQPVISVAAIAMDHHDNGHNSSDHHHVQHSQIESATSHDQQSEHHHHHSHGQCSHAFYVSNTFNLQPTKLKSELNSAYAFTQLSTPSSNLFRPPRT